MTIEAFMPEGLSATVGLALVAVSLVTSFISAALGLGGGVALLAFMAVLLPPAALIPVHGAVQVGSNAGRVVVNLTHVAAAAVIPFSLGSLLGAPLGGLIVIRFPPQAVELAVGLFILWSVFGRVPTFGRHAVFTGGIVSSFLTMFFGATGPFVVTIAKSLGLEPLGVVATHAAFMSMQHVIKIAVFGLLGFAFAPYLPLILGMIVSGLIGTVLGKQVLTRFGHYYFRVGLDIILCLAALRLIWSGAATLLGF
ncbi:MAG: TSUP family transporter [Hyphomicrobiales bacterium]|nr:TSUP family transporter [Hyphomicrobiales bacterium]